MARRNRKSPVNRQRQRATASRQPGSILRHRPPSARSVAIPSFPPQQQRQQRPIHSPATGTTGEPPHRRRCFATAPLRHAAPSPRRPTELWQRSPPTWPPLPPHLCSAPVVTGGARRTWYESTRGCAVRLQQPPHAARRHGHGHSHSHIRNNNARQHQCHGPWTIPAWFLAHTHTQSGPAGRLGHLRRRREVGLGLGLGLEQQQLATPTPTPTPTPTHLVGHSHEHEQGLVLRLRNVPQATTHRRHADVIDAGIGVATGPLHSALAATLCYNHPRKRPCRRSGRLPWQGTLSRPSSRRRRRLDRLPTALVGLLVAVERVPAAEESDTASIYGEKVAGHAS